MNVPDILSNRHGDAPVSGPGASPYWSAPLRIYKLHQRPDARCSSTAPGTRRAPRHLATRRRRPVQRLLEAAEDDAHPHGGGASESGCLSRPTGLVDAISDAPARRPKPCTERNARRCDPRVTGGCLASPRSALTGWSLGRHPGVENHALEPVEPSQSGGLGLRAQGEVGGIGDRTEAA